MKIPKFHDASIKNDRKKIIIHRKDGFCCLSTHKPNILTYSDYLIIAEVDHPDDSLNSSSEYVSQLIESETTETPVIVPVNSLKDMGIVQEENVTSFALFEKEPSTSVKIVVVVEDKLDEQMLLKLLLTANEAKMEALNKMDVRNAEGDILIGNEEDYLMLVNSAAESTWNEDFSSLRKKVHHLVKEATINTLKCNGYPKSILEYIQCVGVTVKDLVDAGMELCVGVDKTEEIEIKLHNQIMLALEDINVISLVLAGIRVEEDYREHRIQGVNVDDDPAFLYADEVLGMSIANQIAGTKAIFNFKRYDEAKPGIISDLGPMLDDVFAGIVAGCMSKIFEERV